MRGTHRVTVRNRRVQFTLELERNITVIRGDSATGKTTLMGMLRDYEEQGIQSGVSVSCDKPCRVLSSFDWESRLRTISDSIVFIDEGNAFVKWKKSKWMQEPSFHSIAPVISSSRVTNHFHSRKKPNHAHYPHRPARHPAWEYPRQLGAHRKRDRTRQRGGI